MNSLISIFKDICHLTFIRLRRLRLSVLALKTKIIKINGKIKTLKNYVFKNTNTYAR